MEMTGERRIPASRERVWQALNDPLVLQASIPGCESLEKLSDTELRATVAAKVGPIATRFTGRVRFTDIDRPNSCRIAGEGQGGVAGFAKGGADLRLTDDGAATLLTYAVQAQLGGKLAQGGGMIDFKEGGIYQVAIAIHAGHTAQRFHYVSFERTLAIGSGAADFVAVKK